MAPAVSRQPQTQALVWGCVGVTHCAHVVVVAVVTRTVAHGWVGVGVGIVLALQWCCVGFSHFLCFAAGCCDFRRTTGDIRDAFPTQRAVMTVATATEARDNTRRLGGRRVQSIVQLTSRVCAGLNTVSNTQKVWFKSQTSFKKFMSEVTRSLCAHLVMIP